MNPLKGMNRLKDVNETNEFNLSRRQLLKSMGVVGGGLVVGISLTGCGSDSPLPIDTAANGYLPNAFLQITSDNSFVFYCPRDEMGQGITTGLATLFAEELDVAPQRFEVKFPGVHPAYNNPAFGAQGTGGSASIRAHYEPLRQAAANLRSVLIQAAAADLGVAPDAINLDDAHVVVNGQRHPFGQFIETAKTLPMPTEDNPAPLKAASDFKYIGKEFPRLDGVAKSTGTAVFGIDVELPNMHYAAIKHSPVIGSTVASVNKTKAENMPGVTDIVTISSGVAIVAEKFWQAKKAAEQLEIKWNTSELANLSTEQLKQDFKQMLDSDEGVASDESGDVAAEFASKELAINSEYWAPMLSHSPLEPMSAVARVENGKAEVWSGTQGVQPIRGLVARALDMTFDQVSIHNTYCGGGFGRRSYVSHCIEAAEIAAATSKPIHLLWSREDDTRSGVFRPASLMRIKATMDEQGTVTGWQAKRAGGNIMPQRLSTGLPGVLPTAVPKGLINTAVNVADSVFENWIPDPTSVEGLSSDYDFPNKETLHATINHGLPLHFWRSVGHSFTAFAKESAIDELAHKAGMDVVDFRLKNSQQQPRINNVIKIAGDQMKQMQTKPGHHLGFAAHSSFESHVAQVAEVSVEDGRIHVHKVVCVVDCGRVINPDIVRAQMEGSIMYGLTATIHGNLQLKNGGIKESNFHDYPILRMNEAPNVEVIIVDSEEAPTGVGEPGLPPIAPAVANAVFAATGQRLRSLPLTI